MVARSSSAAGVSLPRKGTNLASNAQVQVLIGNDFLAELNADTPLLHHCYLTGTLSMTFPMRNSCASIRSRTRCYQLVAVVRERGAADRRRHLERRDLRPRVARDERDEAAAAEEGEEGAVCTGRHRKPRTALRAVSERLRHALDLAGLEVEHVEVLSLSGGDDLHGCERRWKSEGREWLAF